jgi:hypothetical protein
VIAAPGDTRFKADGAPVLRRSDTFTVSGCPFTQSPCATVEWPAPAGKSKVGGDVALRADDVGLCKSGVGAAQGNVVVSSVQGKASGV